MKKAVQEEPIILPPPTEDASRKKKRSWALKAVVGINAAMGIISAVAGVLTHSSALLATTLDSLSDTVANGASLAVANRSKKAQAGVALGKGVLMGLAAVGLIAETVMRFVAPVSIMPVTLAMGVVGALSIAASAGCVAILKRYEHDNINMKSAMACNRNDMVANMGVMLAAGLTSAFVSPLPDLIIGSAISLFYLKSAASIGREAWHEWKQAKAGETATDETTATPGDVNAPRPGLGLRMKNALGKVFNRKAARETSSHLRRETYVLPVVTSDLSAGSYMSR